MAQLGTVQTVVVCVRGSGLPSVCPDGYVQSVTQAYLVVPSEGSRLDLMSEPFDAVTAGEYFGFAFASTVFVWLFSLGVGMIIRMVRSA